MRGKARRREVGAIDGGNRTGEIVSSARDEQLVGTASPRVIIKRE